MKKERLEAITDAILAIILTLMVLEIKLPELTVENIAAVIQLVIIYAVSFIYIAIIWLNHHRIFNHSEKVHVNLVWLNFALLFFISLIPLATEHLSADFHAKGNHVFFGIIISIVTIIFAVVHRMVMNKNLTAQERKIIGINWFAISLLLLSIPFCFISVYLSGLIFIIVPVIYFLVGRKE